MENVSAQPGVPNAVRVDLGAIFVSLELSRSTWLVTSLSPGSGDKMSKRPVDGGDIAALINLFEDLRKRALSRTGRLFPIVTIQEAGLDGFWIHRVLEANGFESHVVDAASIAASRRRRRAKTDKIDGEALVRALLAFKRGEPRVCAMVKAPSPDNEDRRRICRERKVLIAERVEHVNRIKGLLFAQGISGYEPLRKDRRKRLDGLVTGDGRQLPRHLKAQIDRELDRLELLLQHIAAVEQERDAMMSATRMLHIQRLDLRPCWVLSKGLDRSSPLSSWPKGSLAILTTDAKSPPTQDWHRRRGKAEPLIVSKAYRKRAIRGCARR
ncbi:insertion sequence transposase protein [Mesorhizobium amorphae CCNWGS0123]|uniref:Insertion sequence transposase protein n=1 Tax=Mesorhizobium amorphae CCNWGS0123 TaxID=1082933 RepID=G6Y3S1_9HYPH|nr:transposase [Mesorhizobium amorphae CCNWGS0123]EHH13617.1 insertion sequence transposase protein [Mesorhizobium amorphae CCNWGS0123]